VNGSLKLFHIRKKGIASVIGQVEQIGQKLIYLADDEPTIREALLTFLEDAGYEVQAFETGDLLLAAFAERPADMVILDVMMPGSNGFSVSKELRRTSHVPIFILSARDSDLDYQTGLDLGCDDFFTKPVSPMNVVMRVKAMFRRIAYEREALLGTLKNDAVL